MHSRIFQLSTKPIEEWEYSCESDFYDHWFTSSVADYVDDSSDRNEDIEWLKDCVKGIEFGTDENGEYLIIENKEEYFKDKFARFQTRLDSIKSCNLEDFIYGIHEMYALRMEYENKYGFYAYVDDELLTFDSFIRLYHTGTKLYIGGTLDYHA